MPRRIRIAPARLRRRRTPLAACALLAVLGANACRLEQPSDVERRDLPAASRIPKAPDRYSLGHAPTPALLAQVDIDANPAGSGLPPGRGTSARGATIYAAKCALCHGTRGEGQGPYPRLVGAEPRTGFPFGRDPKIPHTIGNYWPSPTTLYDYIHRAMPLDAPGSLPPDEVYSLVAWLLAENEVVPRTAVIDARSLPQVKMPARPYFVRDDRTGGQGFR